MTTPQPAQHPVFTPPVPQLVFLGILGGTALLGAVVFAVWGNSIDVSTSYLDYEDAELKAGVGAWADILLITGIVASVGAIVLDGVLHLSRRVVSALEGREQSPTDAA